MGYFLLLLVRLGTGAGDLGWRFERGDSRLRKTRGIDLMIVKSRSQRKALASQHAPIELHSEPSILMLVELSD